MWLVYERKQYLKERSRRYVWSYDGQHKERKRMTESNNRCSWAVQSHVHENLESVTTVAPRNYNPSIACFDTEVLPIEFLNPRCQIKVMGKDRSVTVLK